ncbi:MAG TPA: ion transporter [Burkholderiaceae bacterium]|nr:ion transporter [Burkholderiaceae bacterium]HMX10298.1 ion transporter [Burkholderiaceae bacterium]HMY99829.1 ion transporter [Burkholderiaceae bacterium]HNG80014.1 ion transporter [Burkholderiaceae bacterium]
MTAQASTPTAPTAGPAHEASSDAAADALRYGRPAGGWRLAGYRVIFESDTPAGRRFDIALIWAILASIVVVVLDSVASLAQRWGPWFDAAEWGFTLLFTAEFAARLVCIDRPRRYALSFYGLIDLLSVAPTYLAVLVPGLHALIDVRILRLLRIFRIFKLSRYASEMQHLRAAITASRRKILVFLGFVLMVVLVMATLMYVVEGAENGYTSIPVAMYWAITTMTTVGFGDITPKTDLGRLIASLMMLLGWGVLAVPTGIVTAEMSAQRASEPAPRPAGGGASAALNAMLHLGHRVCSACDASGHSADARYCRHCGAELPGDAGPAG